MSNKYSIMFRKFKRHYHKVGISASSLGSTKSFGLKITCDGQRLHAETILANDDELIRFVVLMRRFLNPSDTLYYKTIWSFLRAEFAEAITTEITERIENTIERLTRGQIRININDDEVSAEKIYQLLSDGVVFGNKDACQKYLLSLKCLPVVGPLFWHQFYEYTMEGYQLIKALCDIIVKIEGCSAYKALCCDTTIEKARCIYCLSTTAAFTSEEHIFPESLGNDELVLPRGYACDNCNNGILAQLDNSLIEFSPVAMLRVLFVPYTKAGKPPRANFQNMSFERKHPNNIKLIIKDKSGQPKDEKHLGNGVYSFTLNMKGRKANLKLLGRALYKVALGTVALSQGRAQACSSKYDAARNFIRYGQGFPNNLLIQSKCKPQPEVQIRYIELSEGTPFAIDIYGITFLLNLEAEPIWELNDELLQKHFEKHSLFD